MHRYLPSMPVGGCKVASAGRLSELLDRHARPIHPWFSYEMGLTYRMTCQGLKWDAMLK